MDDEPVFTIDEPGPTVDEPGFTINVAVSGQLVSVHTSAAIARRNVIDSSTMRGTGLSHPMTDADVADREALHAALSIVAADVLLAGDQSVRVMQDKAGNWWSFRREEVGAVEVVDDASAIRAEPVRHPLGFRLFDRSPFAET